MSLSASNVTFYGLKTSGGTTYALGLDSSALFTPELVSSSVTKVSGSTQYTATIKWKGSYSFDGGTVYTTTLSYTYPSKFVSYDSAAAWSKDVGNVPSSELKVVDSAKTLYVNGVKSSLYTYTKKYYIFTFTLQPSSMGALSVLVNGANVGSATGTSSTVRYSTTPGEGVPKITIKATASNGDAAWHRKYYFKNLTVAGTVVSPQISTNTATYTFTPSDNKITVVSNYGDKYALKVASRYDGEDESEEVDGLESLSVSYSRTRNSGYVTEAVSPTSISSPGTLYVEPGCTIAVMAQCASGYAFTTTGGVISLTTGYDSVYGSNSSDLSVSLPALTSDTSVELTYTVVPLVMVGDESHADWGIFYIDEEGTTTKSIVAGQKYKFGFKSSRDDYEAPTVKIWCVNGSAIDGDTWEGVLYSGTVTVTCLLEQHAWPVEVSARSNGSATITKRYNIETGAQLAATGYVRADGTEYIVVTPSPDVHFKVFAVSKTNNLVEYEDGGEYAYTMSEGGDGTVSFSFSRYEGVVRVVNPNPEVCDVSPTGETAVSFTSENPGEVYCQIKDSVVSDWKVPYFTAAETGSTQYPIEYSSGGRYVIYVYGTTMSGHEQLTFTPYLATRLNTLSVAVNGAADFAVVTVQTGTVSQTIDGRAWSATVRENTAITISATPKLGGSIVAIDRNDVEDAKASDNTLFFAMPLNPVGVTVTVSEKNKVSVTLQIANASDPDVAVESSINLSTPLASEQTIISGLDAQTLQLYEGMQYSLVAQDQDEKYVFSGWYKNDSELVSSSTSFRITTSDLTVKYTAKYVLRTTGTIAVSYALKNGDAVSDTELPATTPAFGLVIDTLPQASDPDRWVVGSMQYITFHVTDDGIVNEDGSLFVWTPVRVDVKTVEDAEYSIAWTYDPSLSNNRSGQFVMRGNMVVRAVYAKTQAEGFTSVSALFSDGSTPEMGELSIFSTQFYAYSAINGTAVAVCAVGRKAIVAASPKPGWAFAGWYEESDDGTISLVRDDVNGTVLTVKDLTTVRRKFRAAFAKSNASVLAWGDGDEPKHFTWRSKVYVGAFYHTLRNVRVYSDAYPVKVTVFTATSPNEVFGEVAKRVTLTITSQSPRMFPPFIRDKYFAFSIEGDARVNHIALASSMEALK